LDVRHEGHSMRLTTGQIVLKCLGAAVGVMLLVTVCTLSLSAASYEELVAQTKQDQKFDLAALRQAYVESPSYDPFNTEIAGMRVLFDKAVVDGDCEAAIKHGHTILEKYYLYIDVHAVLSNCYRRVGHKVFTRRHAAMALGLFQAILASGDGKAPETAYVIIAASEQETMLRRRGLRLVHQELINKDGRNYHLITAMTKGGAKAEIYFNVDPLVRWSVTRAKERAL